MLNELEEQILNDIYEMRINNGEVPKLDDYKLKEKDNSDYKEKSSELAYYLYKLKSLGHIKFLDSALLTGGWNNPKYNNSVILVHFKSLDIENKGIEHVEKMRETRKDKLKKELKETGKDIYKSSKTYVISALIVVLGTLVTFLWNKYFTF